MKTLLGSWLMLGLAAIQAEAPMPELKIQVFVYNYAAVPSETLARAEGEAARIYNRTGIETEWLDCPLTPAEKTQYPACQVPASHTQLALRVLPRSMAERAGLVGTRFGTAYLPEDGEFGTTAQVCAQCPEELAKGSSTMYTAILGHVIAHELGHLLLGVVSHAPAGLMHYPWCKQELDRIAQGSLLFSSRETEKMRTNVRGRIAADVAAQATLFSKIPRSNEKQ